LGGGQVGYNFQSGWAVLGVQGDVAGMDVKGTTPCVIVLSCTTKSDWLATVSGRFGGVVADRTLVYAKGGAAWMISTFPSVLPVSFGGDAGLTQLTSVEGTSWGWRSLGRRVHVRQELDRLHRNNYIELTKRTRLSTSRPSPDSLSMRT
jgi:outer membrane immunogenic protein